MNKIVKIILILIVFAIVLCFFCCTKSKTPSIKGKNSVSCMKKVPINGTKQHITVRGKNKNLPLLLFVHGGPGFAETSFFRHYNSELEDDFLVVNWDQRGAGKSYDSSYKDYEFHMSDFVEDIITLSEYLLKEYSQEKLFLVAHSWGTAISMLAVSERPDLFHAYVGMGQIANLPEQEIASYDFTLKKAKELNNKKAIEELEKIGPPVNGNYKDGLNATEIQRKWLLEFGGAIYKKNNYSDMMKVLFFKTPEYGLQDKIKWIQSMNIKSKNKMVENEFLPLDLTSKVTKVEIPIYFFLGQHDYQVDSKCANNYFNDIDAESKKLVWFMYSAHSPCFEQPDQFNKMMVELVKADCL